jgi:hypothetical protein
MKGEQNVKLYISYRYCTIYVVVSIKSNVLLNGVIMVKIGFLA